MAFWTPSRKAGAVSDIAELRAHFDALFQGCGAPPGAPPGAPFEDGKLGPISGEWTRGASAVPAPTVLYFHGGGYVAGSPQSHRGLIGRLAAAAQADIFAVRYRLAPESTFPAAVRDGIDAYRGLIASGVRPAHVILSGDGAGGGLAFSVALAVRNAGLPMPAGIAVLSPWADLSLSGWSLLRNRKTDRTQQWDVLFQCARHYLRKSSPADPYASPVFAALKDFPPIMVHAGALEILRDDASRLGDRATEAAVPVSVEIYDGEGHLFQAKNSREAQASLARLGHFMKTKAGA